jgi:hypothetical protein
MFRRSIFVCMVVVVAMLALAAPALAGGWAVVTLDSLPREVRAGQSFQLGFVVRQHGKTPTNTDLNGKPLKPVLSARKSAAASQHGGTLLMVAAPASVVSKGEQTIRVEARQEGAVGHYVVDVTFPSDGVWDWQIEVPTYYVQNAPNGDAGNAAFFAPLTVQPAAAAPAPAPAATTVAAEQAAPTLLGLSPAALRWVGAIVILAALVLALYSQRGLIGRRRVVRSQ